MIVDRRYLHSLAYKWKRDGKSIVTTNGCFDILHAGHLDCLEKAKEYGDVLVVGVNADDSPYFLSKPGRPIVLEHERVRLVSSLRPVDLAFLFSDEDPSSWILEVRPNFHVKATDGLYGIEQCVERKAVELVGGKVVLVPKLTGLSTTSIIARATTRLLNVARGCHDYGGGYRGNVDSHTFHHGIQTVISALEAYVSGEEEHQVSVLEAIGRRLRVMEETNEREP